MSKEGSFGNVAINAPIEINFKTTGVTTIYTVPAGMRFCPIKYLVHWTDSSSGADPNFSMGTNASDYDNLLVYVGAAKNNLTNQTRIQDWTGDNQPTLAENIDIKVNVTGVGLKTTCKGKIYLFGILVPM